MNERAYCPINLMVAVRKFTTSEIEDLEREAWNTEASSYKHCLLISSYFLKKEDLRLRHVLWLVANEPQNPFLYWPECTSFSIKNREKIAICWQQALTTSHNNAQVLRNAASFYADPETGYLKSVELLLQVRELDGPIPNIDDELKFFLRLHTGSRLNTEEIVKIKTLSEELLVRYPDDIEVLETLIRIAMKQKDFTAVKRYCDRVLKLQNNNNHLAHTALGLVFLTEGLTKKAKEELVASSRNTSMHGYHPYDFALAYALLQHGERAVVCRYILSFWNKWTEGRGFLIIWIALITIGIKPALSMSSYEALYSRPMESVYD